MHKRTTTWATPSHPTSRYCCCYLTAAEGALHMTSEHKGTNYASNLQYVFKFEDTQFSGNVINKWELPCRAAANCSSDVVEWQ